MSETKRDCSYCFGSFNACRTRAADRHAIFSGFLVSRAPALARNKRPRTNQARGLVGSNLGRVLVSTSTTFRPISSSRRPGQWPRSLWC